MEQVKNTPGVAINLFARLARTVSNMPGALAVVTSNLAAAVRARGVVFRAAVAAAVVITLADVLCWAIAVARALQRARAATRQSALLTARLAAAAHEQATTQRALQQG